MKINGKGLQDCAVWEAKGYMLPQFDRNAAAEKTKQEPVWIHFGAGNIFRAFQANVVQRLLNEGAMDTGLIVAEGYDYEIIDKLYAPHDNLGILVTLKADGSVEKSVIGSVMESLRVDPDNQADYTRLKEIFRNPTLQMVTFTITEKGYSLVNGKGELLANVAADLQDGPQRATSYIGKVTALLYERYLAGKLPIAMVSMDNCSHNGDKLYNAVKTIAEKWTEAGLAEAGFLNYIFDESAVSFPWTMIDKITPRPDASVQRILEQDGVEELEQVITSKNTYVAPFVNAEECEYLVIEDKFPNGRPELEKAGLYFTTRETVDKVEKMKVCTCLNPLHTSLAVFGCLLGYQLISEEMKNPLLKKLVERIGYEEGLPVVVDPGIISPRKFIDEVVNVRIPNPFMPDTPQRIATDTSQKLAIRFGETIKAYMKSDVLQVENLKLIPLVFAAWLRYLLAVDDNGTSFTLSPDPMLDTICPLLSTIRIGGSHDTHRIVEPILKNEMIFGVNLYEAEMGELVEEYFDEMLQCEGAVKKTLERSIMY